MKIMKISIFVCLSLATLNASSLSEVKGNLIKGTSQYNSKVGSVNVNADSPAKKEGYEKVEISPELVLKNENEIKRLQSLSSSESDSLIIKKREMELQIMQGNSGKAMNEKEIIRKHEKEIEYMQNRSAMQVKQFDKFKKSSNFDKNIKDQERMQNSKMKDYERLMNVNFK